MVPYMAKKPFPLSDGYTAPAGSIVIPSFWNSLHDPEVYEDPNELKPERWLPGGQAENSNPQNYLVVSFEFQAVSPFPAMGANSSSCHLVRKRTS